MSQRASTDDRELERPLGANEEMFYSFDTLMPTNFALFGRLEGVLSEAGLREALAALQRRHPLLRARIEHDVIGRPWFRAGAGPAPLQRLTGDEASALRRLATCCHARFDVETGPLLRCVWVEHGGARHTITLVFHHTVGDGRSGARVLGDLLRVLNQPQLELPALRPLPYVAELLPGEGTLMKRMRRQRSRAVWLETSGPREPSQFVDFEGHAPPAERSVAAHSLELGPELSALLARRCRDQETTVHGALQAAVGRVIARRIDATRGAVLNFGAPVDVRGDAVGASVDSCGCFIAAVSARDRIVPDQPFWDHARLVAGRLREAREVGVDRFVLEVGFPSLAWMGRAMARRANRSFGVLVEKLHPPAVILSNMGRVEADVGPGPIRLHAMGLVLSPGPTSAFTTTATTLGGRLTWVFLGVVPLLSVSTLRAIADEAHAELLGELEPA